jgi:hypothetical protein
VAGAEGERHLQRARAERGARRTRPPREPRLYPGQARYRLSVDGRVSDYLAGRGLSGSREDGGRGARGLLKSRFSSLATGSQ